MTEARAGLPKRLHDHGKKLRSLALAHIPANKFLRVNTLTWWVAVSVVIAVHLAQRITVLSGKSFYWDDFIITGHLHGMSVFSPDFIFQDHDGHFAPLAFFIQGVVYRVFGWNWLVPSIIIVALSFLLVVGVMRLLECITGRSWVSVFLLAVITWSPLMLTADTWWSAALNALPFQLGLVFFVTTVLRTTLNDDSSPKIADIILLNVTLIVALGFFEKALVIAPLAAMLLGAMAYVQRRNLKQVFDKSKKLWITSGVITVAWAAWYIFGTSHPTQDSKPSAQFELFFNGLGQLFAGAVGGPWQWERWIPGQPFATAPGGLIAVGGILLLLLSATLIGRDYRTWAPWAISVSYIVVVLLAIVVFRSSSNTSGMLAHTLHYYADVVIVLGICIAISAASIPPADEQLPPLPKRTKAFIWALGAVLFVSSTVSVVTYRDAWSGDITADWLAGTEQSLAELYDASQAGGDPIDYALLDQPVPYEILVPVAAPTNYYSRIFDAAEPRPEFARVTGTPRMFTPEGKLIDAKISEMTTSEDGPVEQCGHQMIVGPDGKAELDIPLKDIILLGDWVLQFNATASEDMNVRLSLPNPFETPEQTLGGSTVVAMNSQLRPRFVYLSGGGNTLHVSIEGATPGASLCIGAGAIGPLVPASN